MLGRLSSRAAVRLSALGLLLAMSCGGGSCGGAGGCGGCGDGSYTFPEDDPSRPDAIVQDDVVRVRVNQEFLDFIKPQLPALIASQLGTGAGFYVDANNILHIPLPDIDAFDIGIADAALRQGEALLWLDDLNDSVDIQFEEPNSVRITIDRIRLGVEVRIKETVIGSTSSCPVFGDLGPRNPGEPRHAAEISIEMVVDPGVGPRPDYDLDIRTSIDSLAIDDLDVDVAGSSVYCQEPECRDCAVEIGGTCLDPGGRCVECRIFCGGVTNVVVDLATALIDLIRPLLNGILAPIVDGLLGNTLNNLNGSSAKLESQVDLAGLSGIEALRRANPLGILVAPTPGRFPVSDRGNGLGMEITVNGGSEGELADCVGALDPFVVNRGPVPEPPGADSQNRPYHLFATFASSYLNQLLYSVHRNGTLCLRLGSEDVRELTGGAFTLNASLLSILASDITQLADDTAPVIIELKPRNPGAIELGTGEVTGQDSEGNDIVDWLLKLTLQDLGIAFHVFMHDRYVRVFEVTSDIFVGLNVVVLPDNRLEIALGELRIDDFTETFNEILPNADFAELLPTLLDLVLGAVLNQSLTFDVDLTNAVSDALGGAPLFLRINDIYRDGTQEDFLSLTMTFTSSAGGNLMFAADTQARLHEDDALLRYTDDGVRETTGRVRLEVGQALPYTDQMALEYQVRVDQGLWRSPTMARPDGTLLVADSKLRLPGAHVVEVRSRYAGDYRSLDATPVALDVIVDPFAPELRARAVEDGIEIRVEDRLTVDVATLVVETRADGGEWTRIGLDPVEASTGRALVSWAELSGVDQLEVRAFDAADNASRIATVAVGLTGTGEVAPGEATSSEGCACNHTEGESQSGLTLALGLLALLGLRRRR